ncbi:MAG: nuclear transport factor 2 family protein [Verrucomicrobia bacterium]|nr:nuclear transport factor 2 family protein [Verrucomicrobiota bacterium]MDA1067559.1 nuclear transport factor 2 family protein [Verrucomicrobiota bacterium]
MKLTPKLTPLTFLLISLTVCAFADAKSDPAIAAVLAANEARNTALVSHDLKALNKILASDFNYTHSNNFQETKESHIGSLKEGLRYTKFETSELRANILTPDIVTLNGFFDQTKGKDGNMKSGKYLFMAVWRRAGNTWQLTSFQSALPPPVK